MARDVKQNPDGRARAISALFTSHWHDFDALVLALLPEGELWFPLDSPEGFFMSGQNHRPDLVTIVKAGADHYIPLFIKRLADPDPHIQWSAASALMMFPRVDALRAIFPLVQKHKDLDKSHAIALVKILCQVDFPESGDLLREIYASDKVEATLVAPAMVRQNCLVPLRPYVLSLKKKATLYLIRKKTYACSWSTTAFQSRK